MGMDSPQGTLRVWIDNGDFVSPETFRAAADHVVDEAGLYAPHPLRISPLRVIVAYQCECAPLHARCARRRCRETVGAVGRKALR